MHVTLINPSQIFTQPQVTAGVVPPLGLLYLSSCLKENGIKTLIIDALGEKSGQYTSYGGTWLRGMTFPEIVDRVPPQTDLIGISLMYSPAYLAVQELIATVKAKFPSKKIVLGGAHSTCLPEFTLQTTEADFIIRGEGEITLLNLCRDPNHFEKIAGISYKKQGNIYHNPDRDFISDLDGIPFPDWNAVNIGKYSKAAEPHGCSFSGKWMTLIAGRGCPYGCTFCTSPLIWRRRLRVRRVDHIIREMEALHETYGITDFHFEDENFGLDIKWFHEFCDTLIKKDMNITWQPSNGLRAETLLDESLVHKMKKSGCSLVVFTLESASERMREQIIKKKLDINAVEQAVIIAKKAGIKSTCYFILGLPGETVHEANQSINYASHLARIGLDECVISLFSMLPGSELFNTQYSQGKIKLNSEFFQDLLVMGDLARIKSWSETISSKTLRKLRLYGYLRFMATKALFHPLKILRSLRNLLRGKDELKTERVLRTFLKRFILFKLQGKRLNKPESGKDSRHKGAENIQD